MCDCELPESMGVRMPPVFCPTCEGELSASHGPACVHCGASIGPGLDPQLPCAFCHDEGYAFERAVRLGVYDGLLRSACLEIKQRGSEPLAAALAELTWQVEGCALEAAGIDVVVPVPQHWVQRFTGRHHAAETLAQVWARRLQVPVAPHILRKTRWTKPQARLTPSERRVNLRQAFATVGTDPLAGATVLLADDVMTTGTTAHEASRRLKQAGAKRVVVAVVARGLGRR
jgi:predicted amidophosphoribosyltransferase